MKFLTIIQAGKVIRRKPVCTLHSKFTSFVAFLHIQISYWQAFHYMLIHSLTDWKWTLRWDAPWEKEGLLMCMR